jgi:SSS family solute:Na+ symporter
MHYALRPWP